MDLDNVEALNLKALGGNDTVTVNDLSGTDLVTMDVDLAGTFGGATSDAVADNVTVNGTGLADVISLSANAGTVQVSGLPTLVRITHADAFLDLLTINGLGGFDSFSVGAGVTALIGVTTNQ
jgi:hypothetical protein